jgi:GTP pyrophosphokinase
VRRALGLSRDLAIQVHGHGDLMVYRAKCCNPVRGEEIIGYITRGRGIAVHSRNCPNVQNLMYDSERRIEAEWVGPKSSVYAVKLAVFTEDRKGMLADVTAAISGMQCNIQNIEARTGDKRAHIDLTVDIVDVGQLDRVVSSLRKIEGVYEVERVMHA